VSTEQRLWVWLSAGVCLWAWSALPRSVSAQGAARSERYLLAQPTSYTNVLDAFDGPSLPDLSIALTYKRTLSVSQIAREHIADEERIAGPYRKVARSEQLTHGLSLELAAGVYRDLMLFVRLPLVLSDRRSLSQPADAAPDDPKFEPADASVTDSDRTPLFGHNESSATRSGVPGLDLGVAWGITNQYRTAYLPTWVVQLESRVGLGKVLRPCLVSTTCSEAGVSRGTIALGVDSRWSYRYSWLEPYLGLRYVREWATAASGRFAPRGLPDGLDTSLPSLFELTLGAALMAWEDRTRFQRISVDVRGQASYISAGRDYSPLFDVLGASQADQLAARKRTADLVPIYGLTQVDAYTQLRAELALSAQAAQYVQFRLGLSFMHMTPHLLTGASACVESCSDSAKNPLYRAVIDLPGQRFMLLGNLSYDLFASATGQF
jgi:hypothetical protein